LDLRNRSGRTAERPNTAADPGPAGRLRKLDGEIAIPADSFARAAAFAMSRAEEIGQNEIRCRPTRQAL